MTIASGLQNLINLTKFLLEATTTSQSLVSNIFESIMEAAASLRNVNARITTLYLLIEYQTH